VTWQLGPFTRHDGAILREVPDLPWAAKHLFNPGAVVRDGKVHLLVRGEDAVGRYAGTSRIGLAVSDDGVDFTLQREPVIAPADDVWLPWEAEGGCEDPRIVETPDGDYVCTYTGFDGKVGTLMVATSDDLRTWTKHGPAFAGTPHARRASKSGSIVTEVRDGRLVAARIQGGFWMYWGERMCFGARSDDLIRWTPVQFDATGDAYLQMVQGRWTVNRVPGNEVLRPLLSCRPTRFDSLVAEPGPPAVRTDEGIVLIYNGANHPDRGDPSLAPFAYAPGQALFDAAEPGSCIARDTTPFLRPESADERAGQVDNVCFAQGLVLFGGTWRLYFGMADARIGCATAPA